MTSSSRFYAPAWELNLKSLMRKTKYAFLVCLGTAALAHLSLVKVGGFSTEQQAAKPLTTQFIKRQPRLTKPLEMKKRPQPKRRQMQRRMVAVKAQVNRQQATTALQVPRLVGSLARPKVAVARATYAAATQMEPQVLAQQIVGTKVAKNMVDMSLEMMDIEALDTGQYQAMVIQDSNDKRNLKGFLHFGSCWLAEVIRRDEHKAIARQIDGYRRLIWFINDMTGIKADFLGKITYDSDEFFNTPWVYLSMGIKVHPTEVEKANLGKYMLNGGFFMIYGADLVGLPNKLAAEGFVKEALATQGYNYGKTWTFERLPHEHEIYHCYFDFDSGPPTGDLFASVHLWHFVCPSDMAPYTSEVNIGNRIVCLFTNQGYQGVWSSWGRKDIWTDAYKKYDPTRGVQFVINTIVFALTQEGSITHRVMNAVQ